MLKTNQERVVKQSVVGEIRHPRVRNPYVVNTDGKAVALPSVAAITYNIRIGDSVYAFEGDHLEPAVTIRHSDDIFNGALNYMSCVGNRAKVISGDAKGEIGYVTGTHGGVEEVMVDFTPEQMEKMAPGDKILVQGYGQGLKLLDYPDVVVMNLDPEMLNAMGIEEKDGKLHVPVAAVVPAYLMGSGLGSVSAVMGDYDIQTADRDAVKENGLEDLKFGDIVFLQDCDTTYGRGYLKGSGTVGVIIHGDCVMAGHGPGVTSLLSAKAPTLVPVLDKGANIKNFIFNKDRK